MEETKGKKEVKKENKLSYEQLENVASQLSQQNQQLVMRLRTVDNMFKRLDYLFKVLENGSRFSTEFLQNCVEEIEIMLTVPEEEPEETKK